MKTREKFLYHQIHPLKLTVDWGSCFASAYFMWRHSIAAALAVGFIPSLLISAILIRWSSLDGYASSAFGQYVRQHMTRSMELLRFAGLAAFWTGAWRHSWLISLFGLLVIIFAWARGLLPR
jgi:hypothetical protein